MDDKKPEGEQVERAPKKTGTFRKIMSAEERALLWARIANIVIPTLIPAIITIYVACKGEPKAEEAKQKVDKTWVTLRDRVNDLAEANNKFRTRLVYIQGRIEGHNAGTLLAKMAKIEEENKLLRKSIKEQGDKASKASKPSKHTLFKPTKMPTRIAVKPTSQTKQDCKAGHVRVNGQCRKTANSVATLVVSLKDEADTAKKRLKSEIAKRRAVEHKKKKLQRQMQVQQQVQEPLPKISPLPSDLDNASKK